MPLAIVDEIEQNFIAFEAQWPRDFSAAMNGLAVCRDIFLTSFVRISSFQAWRTCVLETVVSEDASAFFFEAQNDLLISHCLARSGSFRQALKALRSSIENVLFALYYKDHPIELIKWNLGQHKLGFSELMTYFEGHPLIAGRQINLTGLDLLKSEYSTLSKAVHGSAKGFRMTERLGDVRLWIDDKASVGKWSARERDVIAGLNLLLLSIFQEHLQGAKVLGLRQVLGLSIKKPIRVAIKKDLGITLIGP